MSASLKRLVFLNLSPRQLDMGLLVLRVAAGLTLFLRHGYLDLAQMRTRWNTFGDPIGVGGHASFAVAMLSDGICSLLLMSGLVTRWAGLFISFNVFMAWASVHHFDFFVNPGGARGELCMLYIGAGIALFLMGPGRYSLDAILSRGE